MKTSEFSVLVVDDDPMVASALRFFVEARGYRFSGVSRVAEATRALAAEPFDIVLLDLYLPDGDGLAVLDASLELDPPPVVIAMTARTEIRGAVAAIRRGAADYLAKPFDLDDLGARLERALRRVAPTDSLQVGLQTIDDAFAGPIALARKLFVAVYAAHDCRDPESPTPG